MEVVTVGPSIAIIAGVALLAVAAAIALVMYIAKGSVRDRKQTAWLCVGLLVAAFVGIAALNFTAVNYTIPPAWIVALVIVGLTVLGLFVRIGMDVRWRPLRVLALVGVVILASIVFAAVGMSGIGSQWIQPLYRNRVAQIAEANGFTALLPAGQEMPTDSLPVDALPAPDAGLGVSYEDFWLQERKSEKAMTEADLEKLVAPGAKPMGPESPPIPDSAKVTTTTVQGRQAVAVEYELTPEGAEVGKTKADVIVVLVFELDGVDVRMESQSGVRESSGDWVPFSNLTVDGLAKIAETFEPVE